MPRVGLIGLVVLGAFAGCGTFSATETVAPAADAGGTATSDADTPDATSTPPIDSGCVAMTATATLVADTELAGCGQLPNGAQPIATIGQNPALFRFEFQSADVAALARAQSITGGTLHLTTVANNATAGTLEAHIARNDWDEGTSPAPFDGADFCRRTSGQVPSPAQPDGGLGWGKPDRPWSGAPITSIASPADYAIDSVNVDYATAAPDVTFVITALPATLDTVSFFVEVSDSLGSQITVATKESAIAHTEATFAIAYCK